MQRATVIVLPPRGAVFTAGLLAVVALMHLVSSMLLTEFGFSYEESGGSALEKVHPATWLMAIVFLSALLATGRPFAWLDGVLDTSRGTLALVVMSLLIMAHALLVVRIPFTNIIDTFLAPIMMYFLLKDLDERRARWVALLIHALMLVNAMVALGEFATGLRVTPFWVAGKLQLGDWRSTALLGHPLANAWITGVYLLAIALGAGQDLPRPLRVLVFVVNAVAMIAFGGRAATVLAALVMIAGAALAILRFLAGGRVSRLTLIGTILALPVAIIPVLWAADHGFFQLFIERFVDDQGSASTRIGMFRLLGEFSVGELLIAPDARAVETMQYVHGLDFGIESFWVSFILQYGIIPSLCFFAALIYFLVDVIQASGKGSILVLLYFLAVASTSVSLSGKGLEFAIIVTHVLVLMRRKDRSTGPRLRVAPSLRVRAAGTGVRPSLGQAA